MILNFIFDFDGTIIDSFKDVYDNLKKSVLKHNLTVKFKNDKSIMKFTLNQIMKNYYPEIDGDFCNDLINDFKAFYDNCDYENTKLFENAEMVLDKLKRRNKKLFIVTNKRKFPVEKILEKFKIRQYFIDLYPIDKFKSLSTTKKELVKNLIENYSLDKKETVLIGDMESDIKAAKDNFILSVAYLKGYGLKNELGRQNPDFYINNLKEILTLSD